MVYIVVSAQILNDGSVQEGKRRQVIAWPVELNEGGLYFLKSPQAGKGKLYRIVSRVNN